MSFFSTTPSIISALLNLVNFSRDKKKRKVEALSAVQLAVIETRKHMLQEGHRPNTSLSRLWLTAFERVESAQIHDEVLISSLRFYQKARFWSDPESWRNELASMELIPSLKELEEYCESLIAQIGNR